MSEPWWTYLVIFVCVAVATHQAQTGLAGMLAGRRRQRQRRTDLAPSPVVQGPATLRRRAVPRLPALVWWDRLRQQSGVRASSAAIAGFGTVPALLLLVLVPLSELWLRLSASVAGAALLVVLVLRIRRARRIARFGEQLPEVLDLIVRSLRAGHPLPVSLALVAREAPDPAGPEFALVVDEMNYGRSIAEALDGLQHRIGHPELAFIVAAVSIANQTGGNLGEILARLSRMLRERFRLARRVRALTAEGRFSGYALSALPVILFGVTNLVSATYYAEFWASPASTRVLAVALGLLLVGNAVIYRLVNFKA